MAATKWLWALRLAALAWLFLAYQGVLSVRNVVGWGWYGEDDPTSRVVLALLPLALAWMAVLVLSLGPDRLRRLAAALALGLSFGGIPLGALWLLQLLLVGPRAGDVPNAIAGFTIYSVVPQVLAVAASTRINAAIRLVAPTSKWDLVLCALALIAALGLNALADPGRPCFLGSGAVIGDLRTIISSEATYASSNGDAYAPLDCLVRPTTCLSGYPAQAPVFLEPAMLRPVRNCYRFTFYAGPPALSVKAKGTSTGRDSVESYAVTAVPEGPRAGRPGFCMDATGILLFSCRRSHPRTEAGPLSGGTPVLALKLSNLARPAAAFPGAPL